MVSRFGVWMLRSENICRQTHLPEFESFLTEQERGKAHSFRSGALRENYIVTRGFTKWVLAQGEGVNLPADIILKQDEWGRPYIKSLGVNFDFNVSHCDGLVVVALSPNGSIGIDVEAVDPGVDLSIGQSYFCPEEGAQLNDLPDQDKPARFFEFWTLKEAYLKALGVGLSAGLQTISFDLTKMPGLGVQFPDQGPECGRSWSFDLYDVEQWKIALCLEKATTHTDVPFYEWTGQAVEKINPYRLASSREN